MATFKTPHGDVEVFGEDDVEVTTETTVTFEDPELEAALPNRAEDALNLMRYFHRRDEMNAEVHHNPGMNDVVDIFAEVPLPKVRYSPITLASERVAGYFARLMGKQFGMPDRMRFTDVAAGGGASVRIPYLEERLSAKDEALGAAEVLWAAVRDAMQPARPTESVFDVDARVGRVTKALEDFEVALGDAKKADTKAEVATSAADRCTFKFYEDVTLDGISWGKRGDVCGWNPEAGVHVQEDERKRPRQHVWRHDEPKRAR